jgi:hypothetical protein
MQPLLMMFRGLVPAWRDSQRYLKTVGGSRIGTSPNESWKNCGNFRARPKPRDWELGMLTTGGANAEHKSGAVLENDVQLSKLAITIVSAVEIVHAFRLFTPPHTMH